MGELYSALGLPEDASQEELKNSFIAWKKEQQNLLKTGTCQERESATKRISEITVLYKKAMGRNDLIYSVKHQAKSQRDVVNVSETVSDDTVEDSSNDGIAGKESNHTAEPFVIPNTPVSIHNPAAEKRIKESLPRKEASKSHRLIQSSADYPNQNTKYAMAAISVIAVIVILGGFGYRHASDTRSDTISSFFSQPFGSSDTSSKRSVKKNNTSEETEKSKPVKPSMSEEPDLPKPLEESTGKNKLPQSEKASANNAQTSQSQRYNPGKTPAQREAVQALYSFHENITQKEYRQAYNCLSSDLQNRMTYDGWVPGFRTTVSSTVYDVKVASENPNQIVLTYNLQAIDNPGGTQNFSGTVVVTKTGNGWKLDKITNKAK